MDLALCPSTAAQKIRALPSEVSQVPIIAVTANAMKGDREKYLAVGMTDYVSKPIDGPELFRAILRNCNSASLIGAVEAELPASLEPLQDGLGLEGDNPQANSRKAFDELLKDIEALAQETGNRSAS